MESRPLSSGMDGRDNAPLRACVMRGGNPVPGKFSVGYGENNVSPWGFTLQKDDNIDIAFFKVFTTSLTNDLSSLAQHSPFETRSTSKTEREGATWVTKMDLWLTRTAVVVQVEGQSN